VIRIALLNHDPSNIMEVVRELRNIGLTQGKDFDFEYRPSKWDPITGHSIEAKHAIFTFYVEKWSTWFILKYNGHTLK
jgi:hypothetical protein